jgi:hypothetical protein
MNELRLTEGDRGNHQEVPTLTRRKWKQQPTRMGTDAAAAVGGRCLKQARMAAHQLVDAEV